MRLTREELIEALKELKEEHLDFDKYFYTIEDYLKRYVSTTGDKGIWKLFPYVTQSVVLRWIHEQIHSNAYLQEILDGLGDVDGTQDWVRCITDDHGYEYTVGFDEIKSHELISLFNNLINYLEEPCEKSNEKTTTE